MIPAAIAAIGAIRRSHLLLIAAGTLAIFPQSVIAFSGITLPFLVPAFLLLALGAEGRETRLPGRALLGGLLVIVLGVAAWVAPFALSETACWVARQASDGTVVYSPIPVSDTLSVGAGEIASGCDGGTLHDPGPRAGGRVRDRLGIDGRAGVGRATEATPARTRAGLMRIAIAGGTGFVGSHLATRLRAVGHEVVVISRRTGHRLEPGDQGLVDALAGCDAVVHCAGINRELDEQTYEAVHVEGTRAVVEAARSVGTSRLVMLSFLRARPDGPTTYHRSKWAAEELVRASGLTHTILKAGVIYGRGDHMLDHLSRAFHTFPVFGLVGMRDRLVRPVAVDDVTRLLEAAAIGDERLANRTIEVLGPDELPLSDAVRMVARVTGRRPVFVRLPIAAHLVIGRVAELAMRVPLIAMAQVHILAEGVVEALPFADAPPADLAPATPFSPQSIQRGLPTPGGFGLTDLRCAT